ncbi:MAG: hypothetical protein ABWZ91_03180 [Nocardioides sp.]
MPTTRKRLLAWGAVVVALVVVAVGAYAGITWWRDAHRTDLERAVAMAPHDGQQLSWTDWSGVRDELDLDPGSDPGGTDIADLLEQGFEADLTQTTALGDSAGVMQDVYGFSPATVDWELFSQSEEGAVVMVHLPESADFDAITDNLESAGYDAPDSDAGTWVGGEELLAGIGGVTPELAHVAVDEDRGLILGSDDRGYLESAVDDARDENGPSGLDDVVAAADEPLSAALYTGDHACAKLAMSQADQIDQQEAAELIQGAGEINPVTGFVIGVRPGGDVRVAMSFESEDQARDNADSRARLADGPAPGKAGDFSDLFALGDVTADGEVVTMELDPVEGSYAFSALKDGPVLFATC